LLSPFFVRRCGIGPSAVVLAAALSNIVAVERNHFLFQELTGIGRTAQSADSLRDLMPARLCLCGGAGSLRFAAG
jgi:hypothetical protein